MKNNLIRDFLKNIADALMLHFLDIRDSVFLLSYLSLIEI